MTALCLHLSKVALKGAIDSLRFAAQNCGCVILGHGQRVAAVHPVVLRVVRVYPATGGWRPPRAFLDICIANTVGLACLMHWCIQ